MNRWLRTVWLPLTATMACAPPPAPAPPARPVLVREMPASAEAMAPAPRPEPRSPCGVVPPSPLRLSAPPPDPDCIYPDVVERQATANIAARYHLSQKGSRVDVSFACDGLADPIDTITLAEGAGHGFSLDLYTFTRDGEHFLIRGQRFLAHRNTRPGPALKMVEGQVTTPRFEAALRKARVALNATPKEVVPPPPPGTLTLGSLSSSSHDFHVAIGLRTATHQRRWRYSGYSGTRGQDTYLPLQVARDALRELVRELPSLDRLPDERDRTVFAHHFLGEHPYFDDDFNWWVKERYVAMARSLGTRRLVEPLLGLVRQGDERSTTDTTDDAMAALEAITGWDGGTNEGKPSLDRDARMQAYLDACRLERR